MRKIYGIHGKVETYEVIFSPSGKTQYRFHFTGGSLNPYNRKPACYATESQVFQDVIEKSDLFGAKIHLIKVYEDETPVVEVEEVAPTPTPEKKKSGAYTPIEDVTSLQDAISYFLNVGIDAVEFVEDPEAKVKKFARQKRVTFPNWK